MSLKLSERDERTLVLALALAADWEQSVIWSLSGHSPNADDVKAITESRRNVSRFRSLSRRIVKASK